MTQQQEIEYSSTTEFPYSVKITQTAKGARVAIGCNSSKSMDTAIDEGVAGYLRVRRELVKAGCPLAPEGVKEGESL